MNDLINICLFLNGIFIFLLLSREIITPQYYDLHIMRSDYIHREISCVEETWIRKVRSVW